MLRLRSAPVSQNTAYVAVADFDAIPRLLRRLEAGLGGSLSAFEVMWPAFYDLVTTEPAKGKPPLPRGYPYYVLVESLGGDKAADAERFEQMLGQALEEGLVVDAVIAKSQAEQAKMWALRDDVGQVNRNGPAITFDVSLRIADMPAYVAEIEDKLRARWPKVDTYVFGHLGDGNLHVLVWPGEQGPGIKKAVEDIVYGPLQAIGGSVSAEHGIGLSKKAYLPMSRNAGELALMKALKTLLDPQSILNPGKILD